MKQYKFTLDLDYEMEAENEEDFIHQVVETIKSDWIYYTDEGNIELVKDFEAVSK